jgi:hypothetical protein
MISGVLCVFCCCFPSIDFFLFSHWLAVGVVVPWRERCDVTFVMVLLECGSFSLEVDKRPVRYGGAFPFIGA